MAIRPDMFHSLHCLNAIRKEISERVYNSSTGYSSHSSHFPPEGVIPHIEHCMDRIRQSIMCQGDLSPSPMYWWQGFNLAFGRAGAHTCRKWLPIREWIADSGTSVPGRNFLNVAARACRMACCVLNSVPSKSKITNRTGAISAK